MFMYRDKKDVEGEEITRSKGTNRGKGRREKKEDKEGKWK